MSSSETGATGTTGVRIWDVPIRLFHWSLVALLGFSWWSGKQHLMEWHRLSGYAILALLLFRLYWGLVGGPTARFVRFVRGPRAVRAYLRGRGKTGHVAVPGHNPLGGWSVVAMLASMGTMVVAGLFAVDVDGLESGPLADYVSFEQGRFAAQIHGWVFDVLLALVALHLLAIAFHHILLGENLVGPMITGRRGSIDPIARPEPSPAGIWKVILGASAAALIATLIARGLRL